MNRLRVRIRSNHFIHDLLRGRHFPVVANIGCATDIDSEVLGEYEMTGGNRYGSYFGFDKMYCIDKDEQFRSVILSAYVGKNVEFLCENMENLSLLTNSIDFIFSGWAIQYSRINHDKALSEFKRILKPNGKILISYDGRNKDNVSHTKINPLIEKYINIEQSAMFQYVKGIDTLGCKGYVIFGDFK